jgi:DNA polymerase-3 subunit alpha
LRVSHNIEEDKKDSLLALLKYFNGDTPVFLCDDVEKKGKILEREFWVALNDSVLSELKQRLGEENVKVV